MDTSTWTAICLTLSQIRIQASAADVCDDGWLQHGGHCYYIANESVTWYEAREKCVEMDATLTSILDKETNEFIIRKKDPNTEYWIGLKLLTTDDNRCCQWLDGSNSTWSKWADGEPNGSGNCTRMAFKGKWRDTACRANTVKYESAGSHNISYICKKGRRSTTTDNRTQAPPSDNMVMRQKTSLVIPVSVGVVVSVSIVVLVIVVVVVMNRRRKESRPEADRRTADNIYSEQPTTPRNPPLEMLPSNGLDHRRQQESVPSNEISNGTQQDNSSANHADAPSRGTATPKSDVISTSSQNVSELHDVVRKKRNEPHSGQDNSYAMAESDPETEPKYANFGADLRPSPIADQDLRDAAEISSGDVSQLYTAVRKEKKTRDSSEIGIEDNPNYTSYEG